MGGTDLTNGQEIEERFEPENVYEFVKNWKPEGGGGSCEIDENELESAMDDVYGPPENL